MDERYALGIDLGGTKVEAILIDSRRNVKARKRKPAEAAKGMERVLDNIEAVARETAGDNRYEAVGIGTPGVYMERDDRIYGASNSPAYELPGFISSLRKRLSVPVMVENDGNCLALAEFFASCEGVYSHVLAVIMGTGLGSGLILDNRLYTGPTGGGAEFGHTCLQYGGRLCGCGKKGCAEAYLSGPSMTRRYQEKTGLTLDVQDIYKEYRRQQAPAVELFEESFRMMGDFFANAVNLLDVQAVILGGGVSNLPLWYERVPQYLERSIFGIPRGTIPILKARMGDSAGVFGAAYLALRHMGLMEF
jgi:fructokinase